MPGGVHSSTKARSLLCCFICVIIWSYQTDTDDTTEELIVAQSQQSLSSRQSLQPARAFLSMFHISFVFSSAGFDSAAGHKRRSESG